MKKPLQEWRLFQWIQDSLKKIIENKVKYKYLYEVFDKYHEMPLDTVDWHDGMIKEATGEYKA